MRILLCALCLLAISCDKPAGTLQSTATPAAHSSGIYFLALGDSYTIGESVSPAERWPNQLARALRDRGIDTADPQIIATTGWTTDELSAGIDRAAPAGNFDLVGLLIGVNNQFRHRDPEEYRQQFSALLARSIKFAGNRPSRVFVLSIPDWGVMPFAANSDRGQIGGEIDHFNAIAREESAKAGVRFIDITPISRQAATQPALGAPDGLHPSGQQYGKWVEVAMPIVTELLAPTTAPAR